MIYKLTIILNAMKTQKIIVKKFALALVAAASFLSASSQPPENQKPPMPPDSAQVVKMVEHLTQELSLNEEQKAKI